ncbi:YjbF family lipoprotein [Halomonas sp. MCCC 1A17488]|uniref:YjbF family lipoprotein n=1 Tax=unclassified Halomonas TaxID=2609666 RepID=UPI0018D213A5|nr:MULTISPECIES: YjbF family lipoprotein [unclassified Halomonas]MCE8014823.1 YjbF family lipoprotein [Halomonas sp. MCCC 1A17488]MCG3238156.1 YjbF family lipoprotein [Halomonas sp. MCCC 1A17488]QPP48076.1 YjbF family lipoprotein [Halomonas sp. SS10-MC5]
MCGALFGLAGCASDGLSPLGASLQTVLPSRGEASDQAAEIPYATLALRMGDLQGLAVMGTRAGDHSYWPLADGVLLALHAGGLYATSGLAQDLLATHYPETPPPWQLDTPARFVLVRHWQDSEGQLVRGVAQGTLACAAAEATELPLGDRPLERCTQQLRWEHGPSQNATLWRDPQERRLWAVDERPWPGAPRIRWQVARHWWQ